MSPDRQDALRKACPNAFKAVPGSAFDAYGFQHGDGWFAILLDMGRKLEKAGKHASISQIKEKYAVLCVYSADPEVQDGAIVKDAIDESARTCEMCGAPGRLVMDRYQWESTACEVCQVRSGQGSKPLGE
jgi:hypothetical protein